MSRCSALWCPPLSALACVLVGASCAGELPAVVDIPEVVVESRGAGGGGRLLSLQVYLDASDYAEAGRYEARVVADNAPGLFSLELAP